MRDQRRHPRNKTLFAGSLEFENRLSTMECVVRNTSAGGARIVVAHMAGVPERVVLAIPQRGLRAQGRVAWRQFDAAGIAFDHAQED